MHRPVGVTILALLSVILGVLGLGEGTGLITPPVDIPLGAPMSGLGVLGLGGGTGLMTAPLAIPLGAPMFGLIVAALRISVGTGCLAFAYGAWRLRPWAWTLGIVILVTAVVFVAVAEGPIEAIAGIPATLLLVFYLDQAHVREAFGLRGQP